MPANSVLLTPASSIRPRSLRWLWKGRVPIGALTLCVGEPGQGKSTWTCELAARTSRGHLDGDVRHPLSVAMATAEDAAAQVVVPRLLAAGADLDHVSLVTIQRDDITDGLALPDDVEILKEALRTAGVGLFVIDPLVAHLPMDVNSHRDQDVRRALEPLRRLAEELEIAVVAIVHLNKSNASEILVRVAGSVAFVAAPRSILLLGPDPEDRGGAERILVNAKNNLAPRAPSMRLRLEACEVDGGGEGMIGTSRITWHGEAAGITASDLLAAELPRGERPLDLAMTLLRGLTANGPALQAVAEKTLADAGISERVSKAAKKNLGLESKKAKGVMGPTPWYWCPRGTEAPSFAKTSTFGDAAGNGGPNPAESAEDGRTDEDGQATSDLFGLPPATEKGR